MLNDVLVLVSNVKPDTLERDKFGLGVFVISISTTSKLFDSMILLPVHCCLLLDVEQAIKNWFLLVPSLNVFEALWNKKSVS